MQSIDHNPACTDGDLIICGRYDKRICLASGAENSLRRKLRLWSAKAGHSNTFPFLPVATDGETVLYGTRQDSLRDYLYSLDAKRRTHLLVLTAREAELMLPMLLEFDAYATALETAFPIFPDIRLTDSLERRLQILESKLRLLRRLGYPGRTLTGRLVQDAWYRVERAIRSKNGLDKLFALAPPAPYQEVFRLREERPNRAIVALDFNSMYGACMGGDFPDPRTLKYENHRGQPLASVQLRPGLYRAILGDVCSDFFSKFHPFRLTLRANSFPFALEPGQSVETLLSDRELACYSKFFNQVHLLESLTSGAGIAHPLASEAKRMFSARVAAKKAGQETKQRALKMSIASLHSATNRRRFKRKHFRDVESVFRYVADVFQLEFPDDMPTAERLKALGRLRFIKLQIDHSGIHARVLDPGAADVLHTFSSAVVANARVKVVQLLERLSCRPGLDICYVNADCVHVSVDRAILPTLLDDLSDDLSEEMGGLRVQCVADRGYWFEPGRYWLFREAEVVQFANKVLNHPGASNKFIRTRRIRGAFRGKSVSFAVDRYFSVDRAFSYTKRLGEPDVDTHSYVRYRYAEVADLKVAGGSVEGEIVRSSGLKRELFERIATDEVSMTRGPPAESSGAESTLN